MSQPVCTATTKRGGACRSFALPGRETCLMHTPELRAMTVRKREINHTGGTHRV